MWVFFARQPLALGARRGRQNKNPAKQQPAVLVLTCTRVATDKK
jgi:hypothetical protein